MTVKYELRPSGLFLPVQDLGIRDLQGKNLVLGDDVSMALTWPTTLGLDGQPRLLRGDRNGDLLVAARPGVPFQGSQLYVQTYPVIFWDDMEGLFNWFAGGGGTAALAVGVAHHGGHSMQITTTAGLNNQTNSAVYAPYPGGRGLLSLYFYFTKLNVDHLEFQVTRVDGTTYVDFVLRYFAQTNIWAYKSSDAPLTYVNFKVLGLQDAVWNHLEVLHNFDANLFERVRLNGVPVPMGVKGTVGPSVTPASTQLVVALQNNAAAAVNFSVDDVSMVSLDG